MDNDNRILAEQVFMGNLAASRLCDDLITIVDIWDNLIDKDVPVSDDEINKMMHLALVDIPQNPFYIAYHSKLVPIISAGIMAWLASNQFEATADEELWSLSHGYRHWLSMVFVACAEIIGGYDHARKIAPYLLRDITDGTYQEYIEEMRSRHEKV